MSIVATVICFGVMIGLICINAHQAFTSAGWLQFRRDVRSALHPKADPVAVARLEHELGVDGHEKACVHCTPTLRLPERYSRGGVIHKPDQKMRLSHDVSPAWGGDLHMIYADECFLSTDGVCVRRDDIHKAARPLHD